MFVLIRALVYASAFIGFGLVFLPARVLAWTGVVAPPRIGPLQIVALGLGVVGAVIVVSCNLTFVFTGRGTAAPFDPPRKLVIRGPYRFVRNPMYLGAILGLLAAALFYRSPALLLYAVLAFLTLHFLVLLYEEPVLGDRFGADYAGYRSRVHRWLPRLIPVFFLVSGLIVAETMFIGKAVS